MTETRFSDFTDWIGRSTEDRDRLDPAPANRMMATLDRPGQLTEGQALPPLWHWLYFLSAAPLSELGRDGHPRKGGFLPPIPLPRRMWAGGSLQFAAPLVLGSDVTKRATITSVAPKNGRSGPLCFVTIRHELFCGTELALSEDQILVYRSDPSPDTPAPQPLPAPPDPETSVPVTPSEVMLFRYSALTFNGHRIHYDADYARSVEGYDGLVVHGPLIATLLADQAQNLLPQPMHRFEYRGVAPMTGMSGFRLEASGNTADLRLWARRADGALSMQARAS